MSQSDNPASLEGITVRLDALKELVDQRHQNIEELYGLVRTNQMTIIRMNGRVTFIERVGRWALGGSFLGLIGGIVALVYAVVRLMGGP